MRNPGVGSRSVSRAVPRKAPARARLSTNTLHASAVGAPRMAPGRARTSLRKRRRPRPQPRGFGCAPSFYPPFLTTSTEPGEDGVLDALPRTSVHASDVMARPRALLAVFGSLATAQGGSQVGRCHAVWYRRCVEVCGPDGRPPIWTRGRRRLNVVEELPPQDRSATYRARRWHESRVPREVDGPRRHVSLSPAAS